MKQKITARLLFGQSQLEAVAGELDCEGERSDLAASYLNGVNSKRNTKLTVSSVIVGALITVGTVIVSGKTGQTRAGVGGGLLSAGLGAMTSSLKGKKEFRCFYRTDLMTGSWFETLHLICAVHSFCCLISLVVQFKTFYFFFFSIQNNR